jgi:hypothetical protein
MKARFDFVTNSSSTAYMITNKTNHKKTLVDFVKENPELKDENKGTGQGLQNKNSSSTTQNQEREEVKNRAQIQKISISEFVENILKIANKNGIGEQVRVVAQELNQSASTSIQAMEKVQTRSKIKTFLVGSDYKNLGELRSELVQNRNRIEQLTQTMSKIKNATDQIDLQNQIETLNEKLIENSYTFLELK